MTNRKNKEELIEIGFKLVEVLEVEKCTPLECLIIVDSLRESVNLMLLNEMKTIIEDKK